MRARREFHRKLERSSRSRSAFQSRSGAAAASQKRDTCMHHSSATLIVSSQHVSTQQASVVAAAARFAGYAMRCADRRCQLLMLSWRLISDLLAFLVSLRLATHNKFTCALRSDSHNTFNLTADSSARTTCRVLVNEKYPRDNRDNITSLAADYFVLKEKCFVPYYYFSEVAHSHSLTMITWLFAVQQSDNLHIC